MSVRAFDGTKPDDRSSAVTNAVPDEYTNDIGPTVICAEDTYTEGTTLLLISTRVDGVKPVPVKVKTPVLNAGSEDGETEVNDGAGGALATVNALTFDVPFAAVSLRTVTATLATTAICDAVTCAVNCVGESNVVGIAVPFHNTFAVGAKFVPVMVNWKPGLPAVRLDGASETIVGAVWSVTVNCTTAEPASPLEGSAAVTEELPGVARSDAGIVAVSEVVET